VANRFQVNQHDIAYKFLAARDGEHCLKCRRKPPPGRRLEIDHADNNVSNWSPENLHLLCKNCNLYLRGKSSAEHRQVIKICMEENETARAREMGREGTSMVKELVDFRNASPEMKANSYYEITFREWVLAVIREQGLITKVEAINSGAEAAGCSTVTAGRYLAKLTSSVGPLTEVKDGTGTVVIKFAQTRPAGRAMRPRPATAGTSAEGGDSAKNVSV
jgi:hypothetical protein